MEDIINGEFKIIKEITKNKNIGINLKTKKEVIILKIKNNFFNEKYYDIFLNKTKEEEKKYFANIEGVVEKDNNKIIIVEKGEGNLEENLSESLIYYNSKHIQYIFRQINIAINFLYNNNIQFNKLELSDIIYNIKDNKPFFKLIPFFLIGIEKKNKNKNSHNHNQFQVIKKLIYKLYFNQDLTKNKYTSDENLNDLLFKITNNKLNIKQYLNHEFFINDTKKELKDLILFNENTTLENMYKLNEEYYLLKYKNQNIIKIVKIFPKIIFEYKYDFNIIEKYAFLKDNILLVILRKTILFLKINFTEKKISLIQKIDKYNGVCKTILELNNFIVMHLYKFDELKRNIIKNWIYIYQKQNYNNIFYQLNTKYRNNYIIDIAKKDNSSILLLSHDEIDGKKTILSIIKINGFKTIKKINIFKSFTSFDWFDIDKTFLFMINKSIMIHLNGIIFIDLLNSDNIYEIPDWDEEGKNYVFRIFYDEIRKHFFFLGDSLSIIELNLKERKIENVNSLILTPNNSMFLFLMDDILFTKDTCSGEGYKKNYITYFYYK